jgi:PLP dependent protein
MPTNRSAIAGNIERVRDRMARAAKRAARRAEEITLVAVSKTFPVEAIRAAYDAGIRVFGENRVQEFESKRSMLEELDGFNQDTVAWHLIGHLQSNKVRRAVELFDRIDSVDSTALVRKLDVLAAESGRQCPALVELHLGGELSKSGVREADLTTVAREVKASEHLKLLGLMTIPPFFGDPEGARPYFRKLRELRDSVSRELGVELPVLSMGMSHDFEIAIEEGATEVRIGTAVFGERQKKP